MPVSILMPALSPTMTEGNVAKWLKKVGDNIKAGDIIAEVETDKATMEVESIDEGFLAKIIHNDGAENIAVNSLIGVISLEGETDKDVEAFIQDQNVQSPKVNNIEKNDNEINLVSKENKNNPIKETEVSIDKGNLIESNKSNFSYEATKISISPLAKRIASLQNIKIDHIKGSGPRGRKNKRDLDAYIDSDNFTEEKTHKNSDISDRQTLTKLPLTNIRKTIASRLQESKKTIPHFYLKSKVCAEEIVKSRAIINSIDFKDDNKIKVSYNDIIIKSVASALKLVPEMNSTWNDDSILQYSLVDIGVAVATDNGLFTPVIRSACKKSISKISSEMKEFILKAKKNKLLPEDYNGGSFSISNLGMYNVHEFSAIINPPQSGILAVGEIYEELKLVNDKTISV